MNRDKVDYYRTNGFVRVDEPLFTGTRFKDLESLARTIIDRDAPLTKPAHVKELIKNYPDFLNYIFDERVLGLVENVIGPDIGLMSSTAFIKRAGSESHFKWHNDFYEEEYFQDISKIDATSLVIAIDHSNEETGCIKFIPGSQLRIRRKYNPITRADPDYATEMRHSNHGLDPSEVDLEKGIVSVELPPGYCSFHDVYTVHSSVPNKSDHERILLHFMFFNTNVSGLSPEALAYLQKVSRKKIHLKGKDPLKTCYFSMLELQNELFKRP